MEVTRSIGDAELKKKGVVSTPQIERVTLCERDEFLILACDGLWSVFDAKGAVDFVAGKLKGGMPPDKARCFPDPAPSLHGGDGPMTPFPLPI